MPTQDEIERIDKTLTVQAPRKAGWLLLIAGAIAWAAYGGYLYVTDPEVDVLPKLITAAIVIGSALLLVSIIRQRFLELPHDRYRGVKR
jgi:hypothetical protein